MTAEYSAHHLQVLEGLEAVRKRPGMYIGSTDSRGLMHCVWEIIDNSVDEALGGQRHRASTSSSTPTAASRCTTRAAASPSTSSRAPGSPGSRSSSRSSTPAASSAAARTRHPAACTASAHPSSTHCPSGSTSRSTAAARRGRCRSTAASRGSSPTRARSRPISAFTPFEKRRELRVVGKAPAKGVTGTRIRYWADRQIFTKDAAFHLEELEQRARQTAFLVPGLEIVVRDERAGSRPAREARASTRRDVLPLRRRHLGVRGVPRHRLPDHRHVAADRHRHVHRDGARPAADRRDGADRGASASATSTSRCAGAPATRPRRGRSSTSSRRRRAARTSRDSSRGCMKVLRAQVRAERPPPQGRQRQAREGRHPGRA